VVWPRWDDPNLKAGTMVKGALWLLQEVGVGNVFTKADIRETFPDAAQADRRIRDLRDYGWVLHTSADDATVLREQTRFVSPGAEVWDRRARRAAAQDKGLSAKARDAVMERDEFMCTVCGISGAEEYPDDNTQTAVLSVMRQSVSGPDGGSTDAYVTVCKRCKSGRSGRIVDPLRVQRAIEDLGDAERQLLWQWIRAGRRTIAPAERAWAMYQSLPPEGRSIVEGV
jgi:hypothetical protein